MQYRNVDFRKINNQNCLRKCNQKARKEMTDQGICIKTRSVLDNLPVRCVGDWAYDKIYRLTQYFGIFAAGMRNKWYGLNYIEICSGPGRCIDRENGNEHDGTSLAILNHPSFDFIKKAIFIDNSEEVVCTLNKRIKNMGKSGIAHAVLGDYKNIKQINFILSNLPKGCLNLVLLDPTDCSVPFLLIENIDKSLKNTDFIINIAFGTDLKRNLRNAIKNVHYDKYRKKCSNFLGSENFFGDEKVVEAAKSENEDTIIQLFLDEYKKNLSQKGFIYSDSKKVRSYYYLLFVSKHQTGLEFWRKANRIEPNGQYTLNLT